jgi:hypothetical protein
MINTKTTALPHPLVSQKKIDSLLAQQSITLKDIENYSRPEREHLGKTATDMLTRLKDTERDNFLAKIAPIFPDNMKNSVWEYNHQVINNAIASHMRKYGTMPAKNMVAEATGLSRQTVAKHIKEYKSHPEFVAEMDQFKYMSHNILAKVYQFASNGDMKAAKLYFEMIGDINKPHSGTIVNEQNNYIQINNTILSQENLKQLTAEQLTQIENIITNKAYQMRS